MIDNKHYDEAINNFYIYNHHNIITFQFIFSIYLLFNEYRLSNFLEILIYSLIIIIITWNFNILEIIPKKIITYHILIITTLSLSAFLCLFINTHYLIIYILINLYVYLMAITLFLDKIIL